MQSKNKKVKVRVKCNSENGCNNLFNFDKVESEQIAFGITIQYFKCPKCGKKYLTNIFDYDLNALIWHKNNIAIGKEKQEEEKAIYKSQIYLLNQFSKILYSKNIDVSGVLQVAKDYLKGGYSNG